MLLTYLLSLDLDVATIYGFIKIRISDHSVLKYVPVTKIRKYLSCYQQNSNYYHCEPSILNKDQTSTGYNMIGVTDEDTAKIRGLLTKREGPQLPDWDLLRALSEVNDLLHPI